MRQVDELTRVQRKITKALKQTKYPDLHCIRVGNALIVKNVEKALFVYIHVPIAPESPARLLS